MKTPNHFEQYAIETDEDGGIYRVNQTRGLTTNLTVVASWGGGWDHVSVSLPHRCPTWGEMDDIKHIFFHNEETVVQFHPAESEKINLYSNCLHLWRKQGERYELPPGWMIG